MASGKATSRFNMPGSPVRRPVTDEADEKASEDSAENGLERKLEDQLTNDKLKQLQKIFEEADEDGGGGLDMDEFRTAMRQAMGDHLTDHDLDTMFMKVDTNCDGTVDWDEYLSYMLLEYREKDAMNFQQQHKPLPPFPIAVPNMSRWVTEAHITAIFFLILRDGVVIVTRLVWQIK